MQNLSMENNVPIIPIFMENKARNILVRVMLYTAFLWPVLVCVCVYIYIYKKNAVSYNIRSNVTHSYFFTHITPISPQI
jgi:preprotein translocase subunit SecG